MPRIKRKLPEIKQGDFEKQIGDAIKEKRHVDYLKTVLDNYDDYKKEFSNAFTDKNSLDSVYVFRFTYLRKTPVWRDIAIVGEQTFCELAGELIDRMDWDNDHAHAFAMKKAMGKTQFRYTPFSMYTPGWEDDPFPTYKTDEIRIADIDYDKHRKWSFVFDFGDSHEFDVELKSVTEMKDWKFDKVFPACIDQRGVAPLQYPPCEEESQEWCLDDKCEGCKSLREKGVDLKWHSD